MMNTDLTRFTEAHRQSYQIALKEIQSGRKKSHWMWYIFPQIHSLGSSSTARYYAIKSLDEATAFLQDPYLGGHLIEICRALLSLETNSATKIFGTPDDMKLRSSMTLFALVADASTPEFQDVLNKLFGGQRDQKTLKILEQDKR